ncbi:CHAT domain-containing protein [Candidatus Venteria ishoeyi]|uniref:CHAT domain-containing protein n=1 Tax=Candidatus Venteria ishoeyi TaxID=1899563 RepID=UPI0015B330A0|nr:CHAT domain-containing protein [Candidatus Venteria ishoeyi]
MRNTIYCFLFWLLPVYSSAQSEAHCQALLQPLPEPAQVAQTATALQRWQQGIRAYEQQRYAQAIGLWRSLCQNPPAGISTIRLHRHLAAAYLESGRLSTAWKTLQKVLTQVETAPAESQALFFSQLADVLQRLQRPAQAHAYLQRAELAAKTSGDAKIRAQVRNLRANWHYAHENYQQALLDYLSASQYLLAQGLHEQRPEHEPLFLDIQINQLRTRWQLQEQPDIKAITQLFQQIRSLSKVQQSAALLSLGQLLLNISAAQKTTLKSLRPLTQQILQMALQQTQMLDKGKNQALQQSWALGYLAQLYEQNHQLKLARHFNQQALFFSQEQPQSRYLWEWQQGRLLHAQGRMDAAVAAYRKALDSLQPIRAALLTQRNAHEVFYQRIRPVYYGLADLLLQRAEKITVPAQKKQWLQQAQNTLERMKAAELDNYFQDACLTQPKVSRLEKLDAHTAVLYPIILPDRLVLLLSLPDGLHQFTTQIDAASINQALRQLQHHLQNIRHYRFISQSRKLYQWLISPILEDLKAQQINTLITVPDGALRMVPMAALHDGKQFLIQQFALATTPGLKLTQPRPLSYAMDNGGLSILLDGLSEARAGFAPLPNVEQELDTIRQLFPRHTILLNQDFSLEQVSKALQQQAYPIIHIASHGQFNADPQETFILTHDDKLTMNRLEQLLGLNRYREEAVELLTLSACQTAVGDERAALGLAGVAIKAGARSALASLWFVNDEATGALVSGFYRHLVENPQQSKAQALQQAQIELLKQRRFRHPAFWAPFLLIGNWL